MAAPILPHLSAGDIDTALRGIANRIDEADYEVERIQAAMAEGVGDLDQVAWACALAVGLSVLASRLHGLHLAAVSAQAEAA